MCAGVGNQWETCFFVELVWSSLLSASTSIEIIIQSFLPLVIGLIKPCITAGQTEIIYSNFIHKLSYNGDFWDPPPLSSKLPQRSFTTGIMPQSLLSGVLSFSYQRHLCVFICVYRNYHKMVGLEVSDRLKCLRVSLIAGHIPKILKCQH